MIANAPKRVRMFAGPNGSGKSSLIRLLAKDYSPTGLFQLHRYVNADDLLRDLQSGQGISFGAFDLNVSLEQLRDSLVSGNRIAVDHPFLSAAQFTGSVLTAPTSCCDAYLAAAIADFLRDELLNAGQSFAFETVMSHVSKVQFFARTRAAGYRTYLYFIATDSPDINEYRVGTRVLEGGHDVPVEKIRDRYERTLQLVGEALAHAYRAFLFDNSRFNPSLIAEMTPDGQLEFKRAKESLPQWFATHVLPRFGM